MKLLFLSEFMLASCDQTPFKMGAEWVIYPRILSATGILGISSPNQCSLWSKIKPEEFSFLHIVHQLYPIISEQWVHSFGHLFASVMPPRMLVCLVCTTVLCSFTTTDPPQPQRNPFLSRCPSGRKLPTAEGTSMGPGSFLHILRNFTILITSSYKGPEVSNWSQWPPHTNPNRSRLAGQSSNYGPSGNGSLGEMHGGLPVGSTG